MPAGTVSGVSPGPRLCSGAQAWTVSGVFRGAADLDYTGAE